MTEQSNNRRTNVLLTHDGQTMTLIQWARRLGINKTTLRDRLVIGGWSVEKALSTPIRERKARAK
jgi:hypothetical protein